MAKDDEDEARRLFREAMRDVRRLDADPTTRETWRRPQAPKKRAPPQEEDTLPAHGDDTLTPFATVGRGDTLEYRASGVAPNTLRALRRGQYPVEAGADLHGLSALRATHVLREFLEEARLERARCIKIVHGKGIGSGDRGPVLKTLVNTWLREQADVLAFVSAPSEDGGTGAVYVLLRRARGEGSD